MAKRLASRSKPTQDVPEKLAVELPQPESNTGPAQYEVIALCLDSSTAPVNGSSYYIVMGKDTKKGKYILLHPFTLIKFELAYEEVRARLAVNSWNPTPLMIIRCLNKRILHDKDLNRLITNEIFALLKHYEQLCEENV